MLVIQWECHLPQQMDHLQTALEVQIVIHPRLEQEPINQKLVFLNLNTNATIH
jgi:hypothetical protein